jgi:hypothetical protein
MIYITGDVHSKEVAYFETRRMSNVKASVRYLEILKKYGLSSTLFINGICFENELKGVRKLLKFDVELGGHTYNNFGSMGKVKSFLFRKMFKCIYGPSPYQEKDIKKTRKLFEKYGLKMTSWRTHAFGSNEKTFHLLEKNRVTHVSDLLGETKPFKKSGIIHLPINIPSDQNTIAYGHLRPENADPFASCTKGRINPREWLEIVKKRIAKNEREKRDSILLLHPATMAYIDDYKLFEELCKFLSKYKSGKISEYGSI